MQATAQEADGALPQITGIQVGVANHYKVGHWTPVRVEVSGLAALDDSRIEINVIDSDGVNTTSAVVIPQTATPTADHTAVVYTKVGRMGVPIRAVLSDGGKQIHELTARPNGARVSETPLVQMAATGEFLLALSSAPFGLKDAFPKRDASGGEVERHTLELDQVSALPDDWFGYEAVDVLVIAEGDGAICNQLAQDTKRYAALQRWVELGGRLVVLCGGERAAELLGESGALAPLVPGKLSEVVPLSERGPLERFAEPAPPIPTPGAGPWARVPRLIDVEGNIEVYAGRRPADLPIVVRSARGLGEIAFAAVDLTRPPLSEWSGRITFLQALLRPYVANDAVRDESQSLVTRGYDDLSGALRQRLGHSFALVASIGFALVAALAIAYVLLLGPADYLLVQRWLRKPLAAWITFPLMVLFGVTGALALGAWRNGSDRPRVNRLELVDVDTVKVQVRGTLWATLYSPTAEQFNVAVQTAPLAGQSDTSAETLLSWWGLPGVGIGGMQAAGADLDFIRDSYHYAPELDALRGVPVVTASTKSLLARWVAPAPQLLEAKLKDQDGLATGSIVNNTGRPLRNARLLYRDWGYRLGNLAIGQRIDVGEQSDPRKVKTIVNGSALGGSASDRPAGSVFLPERASAVELLNLMMFYDAGGGTAFAQLPNRYQAYCDLSRLVDLGRAVFIAEADAPGSQLVDPASGEVLGNNEDFAAVFYRFVLPVANNANTP
jgi:hypothetical protein